MQDKKYKIWNFDVEIWQNPTGLEKKKHALAPILILTAPYREVELKVPVAKNGNLPRILLFYNPHYGGQIPKNLSNIG